MYTNLGFFRKNYNKSQSPKSTFDLRLPKITPSYSSSPSSNLFSPPSKSYNFSSSPKLNYNSSNQFSSSPTLSKSTRFDPYAYNSPRIAPKIFSPKINFMSYSIFEIHRSGYTNNSSTYSSATGVGFLITKSLALTANSVIPDESVASRCFAKFVDNLNENHNFDCQTYFYSNKELNITVLGFKLNPESKKPRPPIEFRDDFRLEVGDGISYLNCASVGKNVTTVDEEMMVYTAGSYILPGMPLFSVEGKLQGFHHTCTSSYKFNQGTRIDVVLKSLVNIRHVMTHPELETLFGYSPAVHPQALSTNLRPELIISEEGRFIYWVEWFNKNIYRYDITIERWGRIKISNLEEFLNKQPPGWSFAWGSRLVYINSSLYIIGGVGHEASATRGEVLQFDCESEELIRKKDMIERREGPGVVARTGFIYVLGGKYSFNSCERFSVADNKWEIISPMNYGRYQPVAVLMNDEKFIYVIGGLPEGTVGKSIEKFCVSENYWDMINVVLEFPVVNPGIVQVSYSKFAVLGGRYCKSVLLFDVGDGNSNDVVWMEIEKFPDFVETVYPLVLYKQEYKVYMIKSQEGAAPKVMFYNFMNLMRIDDGFYKSSGRASNLI